jgi:hypothetical protein
LPAAPIRPEGLTAANGRVGSFGAANLPAPGWISITPPARQPLQKDRPDEKLAGPLPGFPCSASGVGTCIRITFPPSAVSAGEADALIVTDAVAPRGPRLTAVLAAFSLLLLAFGTSGLLVYCKRRRPGQAPLTTAA